MPKPKKLKPEIDFRSWRDRQGWTQREAAEYLGVSIKTYQHWEQGWASPKVVKPIKAMMESVK